MLNIVRAVISAVIILLVVEISNRMPRLGALLLTLPVVSILAFLMLWTKNKDLTGVSVLAKETLILVPLGLPFFIPLAFAERLGLGFWTAFVAGIALASLTIGLWFILAPKTL